MASTRNDTAISVSEKVSGELPILITPAISPGPTINDKPSVIYLLSPAQIAGSPLIPPLTKLINDGFRSGHERTGVLPSHIDRFSGPHNTFISEAGANPDTFTYIISSADSEDLKLYATGTAQLYRGTAERDVPEIGKIFLRKQGPLPEGVEQWELRFLVVDQALQGRGLGVHLMKLVEAETKRRFEARRLREAEFKADSGGGVEELDLHLILTTIAETNEEYYKRHGFATTEKNWFPPGTMESGPGFSADDRVKVLKSIFESRCTQMAAACAELGKGDDYRDFLSAVDNWSLWR